MHITTLEQNGVIVINVVGSLTIDTHTALKKKVREMIIEQNRIRILIDVSGIKQIDSSGIGTLVALLNTSRSKSGDVRLAGNFAPEVEQAFNLCGLSRVFVRYQDVKQGIQNFEL